LTCCPECTAELLVTSTGVECPKCFQRERLHASLVVLAKELGVPLEEVVRRAIILLEGSTKPEPPPAAHVDAVDEFDYRNWFAYTPRTRVMVVCRMCSGVAVATHSRCLGSRGFLRQFQCQKCARRWRQPGGKAAVVGGSMWDDE